MNSTNSKTYNIMETTIVIKNQNSVDKPLLTLLVNEPNKPEPFRGFTILGYLEDHISECKISETEPNEQLELIFTRRISISKEVFLETEFYSKLDILLENICGMDPEKQKELLRKYINNHL